MAPGYKPLTSAGGLTGAPNLAPQIFAPPGVVSMEDYDRQNAVLLAQELANQSNEINVSEKQRIVNQQNKLRESLTNQFGDGQNFDPDAALQTAQRIAIESGDLDTALNIERVTKERNSNRSVPLTEAQRQFLAPVLGGQMPPEGTTAQDVNLRGALTRSNAYDKSVNSSVDIPPINPGAVDPSQTAINIEEVPPKFRNKALAEKGIIDDLDKSKIVIADAYDTLAGIGPLGANTPFTDSKSSWDAANSAILSSIQANWKGVPSDKDMEIIQSLLPWSGEDADQVQIKKRQMMLLLENNSKSTPTIDTFLPGLRDKQGYQGLSGDRSPNLTGGAEDTSPVRIPRVSGGGNQPYVPPGYQPLGVDEATGLAIVKRPKQ